MRKTIRSCITALLCLFVVVFAGCSNVPVTGRSQMLLLPNSVVNKLALQQYNAFLDDKSTNLSKDPANTAMLKRVGTRIAKVVEAYHRSQGQAELLNDYQWEFNLVDSEEKNAWAMPGGKIVVYTGLLEITQTEAGLAAVVGHEIAHAIARHGNERMSQGIVFDLGGVALSSALGAQSAKTQELFMNVYAMGGQFGIILPYSRIQEKEADHLGLIYMAMAGYDPQQAVELWRRMSDSKGQQQAPPEFLSTHPADSTRIANIQQLIPEAMQYYVGPNQMYHPPVNNLGVPYYEQPDANEHQYKAAP